MTGRQKLALANKASLVVSVQGTPGLIPTFPTEHQQVLQAHAAHQGQQWRITPAIMLSHAQSIADSTRKLTQFNPPSPGTFCAHVAIAMQPAKMFVMVGGMSQEGQAKHALCYDANHT